MAAAPAPAPAPAPARSTKSKRALAARHRKFARKAQAVAPAPGQGGALTDTDGNATDGVTDGATDNNDSATDGDLTDDNRQAAAPAPARPAARRSNSKRALAAAERRLNRKRQAAGNPVSDTDGDQTDGVNSLTDNDGSATDGDLTDDNRQASAPTPARPATKKSKRSITKRREAMRKRQAAGNNTDNDSTADLTDNDANDRAGTNDADLRGEYGVPLSIAANVDTETFFPAGSNSRFEFGVQSSKAVTVTVTTNANPPAAPAGFKALENVSYQVTAPEVTTGLTKAEVEFVINPNNPLNLSRGRAGRLNTQTNTFVIDDTIGTLEADNDDLKLTVADVNGEWAFFVPDDAATAPAAPTAAV
ncbi:hypothetical protein HYQ44_009624 [Verticillium longisporum]|nr:hypothetical protein HYQ44_009624 [Verticillium longisporum]